MNTHYTPTVQMILINLSLISNKVQEQVQQIVALWQLALWHIHLKYK